MGKLNLTFTLLKTENLTVKAGKKMKTEEAYFYQGSNGAKVAFHAHPTRAWNWVLVPEGSNELGQVMANAVIDEFCRVGAEPEAIKSLSV
jgi:hypothetical protein